jgi:pimeloyl-ACP methyl ester carboxylesterase
MAGRRVGSKGTNSWARGRVGHVGHAGDLTILTGGGVVATIQRVSSQACTPAVFIAACKAMQEIDFTPDLPRISVPTLVLTGELDQMTPVDYGAAGGGSRKIADLIPNAELVLLRGAGHTHLFQQPEATTDAIFRFLDRVG